MQKLLSVIIEIQINNKVIKQINKWHLLYICCMVGILEAKDIYFDYGKKSEQ